MEIKLDLCKTNKDTFSLLMCMVSSCAATLKVISLKQMSIQLNEAALLAEVLTNCEKLIVLDISSLIISHLGVVNDEHTIITKNSATINWLCLSNYNLSTPDTEGITQAIGALTAIKEIVLENCNITSGSASFLMAASTTLKEINSKGSNLHAMGCIPLAQLITHISTLTVLNIDGKDKGAFAIADKLTEVYLNSNNFQVIIKICASLFKLIGLKVLSLSNNHITYQAAVAISMVISKNYLEKLYLSDARLSTHGMIAIGEFLWELHSLKSLDIS